MPNEPITTRRLITRFVTVFAAVFILFGGLDVWTTELGRHLPGAVELNPAGFMPLTQSILWEIPILAVGCLLVGVGTWLRRETLCLASSVGFTKFLGEWLETRYLGLLLLLCPIEIALLRSLAVINNAQQLLMGASVFSYITGPLKSVFGWSDQAAYIGMMWGFGMLAFVPTSWLVYYVARRGTGSLGD